MNAKAGSRWIRVARFGLSGGKLGAHVLVPVMGFNTVPE